MPRIQLTLLALSLGLCGGCGSYSAPSNSQNPPPPMVQANDINIVLGASALTTTAFSPSLKVVSLGSNPSVTGGQADGRTRGHRALGEQRHHRRQLL